VGTVSEVGLESQTGDRAQALVAVAVKTSTAGAAEQDLRAGASHIHTEGGRSDESIECGVRSMRLPKMGQSNDFTDSLAVDEPSRGPVATLVADGEPEAEQEVDDPETELCPQMVDESPTVRSRPRAGAVFGRLRHPSTRC
jgi:hypothetical protein